jgi:hypothetical protein
LGQSGDDVIHRNYFKDQAEENVYYCYITAKMAMEPFSVKLPEDGIIVTLTDPMSYNNTQTQSDNENIYINKNLKIESIQSYPPRTAYRIAKVLLL